MKTYVERLNKIYKEIVNIPQAVNQNQDIINVLKNHPTYYHATNREYNIGDELPVNKYITYSINYAKSLKYKRIYLVTLPSSFVHTKYVGNRWANYHIISKSPSKILEKI